MEMAPRLIGVPAAEDDAVWPLAEPSLAVLVASSMTFSQHPGDHWWQESKARTAALREEHARVIDHYDSMARAREERENAEAASVAGRGRTP